MRSCPARWVATGAMCAVFVGLGGCGGAPPPVAKSTVSIATLPENGAQVLLEGIEYGATPLRVELAPGNYYGLLQHPFYKEKSLMIQVLDAGPKSVEVTLDPRVAKLDLDSKPSGAEVFIDGETLLGRTPIFQRPLRIGPHTFELRMPNYHPHSAELDVEEHYQYEFVYELKPMESELLITSTPSAAAIWINNEPQTQRTPVALRLPPDTYVVGVYIDGYVQSDQRIQLEPNQEYTLEFKLIRGIVPQGMALVPGGPFICGADSSAPDELPQREIVLKPFYIDRYEVTNAQLKLVFPGHVFPEAQAQYPASGVSWQQASDYARAVGKRLPTEAEWEKAARGTEGQTYPWGMDFDKALCNTEESRAGHKTRVGSFLGGMSPFGCQDMAGNVYEWTSDWYQAYPGNDVVTKSYGQVYRVLRGGSYKTPAFNARCAMRHFDRMDEAREDYGLRCALDVLESAP